MFYIALIGFIIAGVLGALLTLLSKKKMERGLGRKVDKLEANSISNWMQVSENEEKDRQA